MTDTEIIKALECCANADCLNCPKWSEKWYSGMCADFLPTVLDLVKRQQSKNETLKAQNGVYETCIDHKQKLIECLEIELKAVRGMANSHKLHYGNLRMEIAREVCDRLKERLQWDCEYESKLIFENDIDNLLKETENECEPH